MSDLLFSLLAQGLVILAGTCLVAAVLKLIPIAPSVLMRWLEKLSTPMVKIVAVITPSMIPRTFHFFLAAFWLLVLRVGLYLGAAAYGVLPMVTP